MIDLSRQTFLEMVGAARVGHPTAIAWLWWRRWIGLWIQIGEDESAISGLPEDRKAYLRSRWAIGAHD